MTQKTILPVVVVVLVLISGFVFYYSLTKIGPTVLPSENLVVISNKEPQITGDIDDAVSSILQASDEEQALLGTGDEEKVLITSDNQEISDFGQSADNYEF